MDDFGLFTNHYKVGSKGLNPKGPEQYFCYVQCVSENSYLCTISLKILLWRNLFKKPPVPYENPKMRSTYILYFINRFFSQNVN